VTFSLSVALTLGVLIAYANGSNDVSKGIATLAGSGVTHYRRTILWGTVWTGLAVSQAHCLQVHDRNFQQGPAG